ncbi:MAG: Asp-tRNA(Asn)/Glu-tRNA(Gln) amidotransferase subunit GatA, partial [Chlamydiia bacterium]|nr:Asp-tRNA(Asn)/Glu-tRNA(Gln) amidotransferase subunit GatA [Chlamydiia bacterium]
IKDNIHIKGDLTTCASKFLANYKAPFDATVIELLRKEDAIFIGKTNLDEFAMGSSTENSAFQKTANPIDLKLTPGGSSGGSAAAVAGLMAPLSLGSDTGGSIRQPASFCGLVGFKPTYGRVSRYGLVAFGSSLDQIGPFARSAKDAALMMEILGRPCEKDSTSLPKPEEEMLSSFDGNIQGMKIGVPWEFLDGLAEEPKKVFMAALERFKSMGCEIVDVDLSILKYSLATYYIVSSAEASTNLARFDGIRYGIRSEKAKTLDEVYDLSREEGFGPEVKRRIMLGTFVLSKGYQDAYYSKAQKVRALMVQKYAEAFEKCDLVATPTSPFAAFEIGSVKDPLQMYLEDIYTISINLAGLPAVSIPSGKTEKGLPLGLQLIGPQMEDKRVLKTADAFEKGAS